MKHFVLIALLLTTHESLASKNRGIDSSAVKSIDSIVVRGLNIVSGKEGAERDWEAFRQLFAADAHISVLVHDSLGRGHLRSYTLEEFVRLGMQYYETDGFIEYEITKTVNEYNGIAQVFQSYYAKELEVEEHGVNSYQLVYDGNRWWITSLLWVSDRNGVKLPKAYSK